VGLDARARRRWFGGVALAAALGMLIAGETVLQGRLSAESFLLYWLVCFLLTGSAIFAAFLDVRALQQQIRQEQRELLDVTLKKIEREARGKRKS
jgi:hypothetical protein